MLPLFLCNGHCTDRFLGAPCYESLPSRVSPVRRLPEKKGHRLEPKHRVGFQGQQRGEGERDW